MEEAGHDTANETSLVGRTLFGKLRVDSVLGRGGMGTVYRVTHLGTQHQRALKVMNPEIRLHGEALSRFLREATVSAALKSPHVVETLDSGALEDGSYYVLMELLEGAPLADIVASGPMKMPRVAKLLREACSALALAHEKGIVHRDIKPDNLFVVKNPDGTESVKILDFGIARFRQSSDVMAQITGENAILGTPLYMAPEQIGNANIADGRADVYALGVVLYEALSGRKPYSASSFAELVAHIFDGSATPLEHTAPGLMPHAYDVVRRAMARKPEDRFQTAGELAEALRTLEAPRQLDALGATAISTVPPAYARASITGADVPGSPTGAVRGLVRARAEDARASILPWLIGVGGAVALSLFAVSWLARSDTAESASGSSVGAPAGGDRAASTIPVAPLRAIVDAGTDAPIVIDIDAPVVADRRVRPVPRRAPDAGRRATPGGLAGPDEIYGEPR